MALTETLDLDIRAAQAQISRLETQLDQLSQPINVPVNVAGENDLSDIRRELDQADNAAESLNTELRQTDAGLDDVGDSARRAGRELDDVGRRGTASFRGLSAGFLAFAGALAAFQGFQVLARGAASAIGAASDLEESLSKTNVVFEEFSDDIEDFAGTAPEALGLSTAAALEATSTFGNLFVALGLSRDAAADLAPEIIQLASDLASFNNIEVNEAVEKLRAGLVGEVEPLRTLGVNLNAALVEAKALELGLVNASGEVTEAGKVQARYALILEQTATAQGDFARTADGIANTQRTAQAEFANLAATVGQALLPAYQALLDLSPAILASLEDLVPVIASLSSGFADAVPGIEGFANGLQAVGEVPSAFGNLLSILGGIANVGLGSLQFLGDFEAGAARTNAGLEALSGTIDAIDASQLRTGLVDALQAGVEPAEALEGALVALTTLDLNAGEFAELAGALFQISGVDPTQAFAMVRLIQDLGTKSGLTEAEIAGLTSKIQSLFGAARSEGLGRDLSSGLELFRLEQDLAAAATATETQVEAFDLLNEAAEEAGVSIFDLISGTQALTDAQQAAADSLGPMALRFLEQVDAIDTLEAEIGALPGAMDAAAAALEDSEGQIVEDFGTFFENLQGELAKREAFESNLAILRALGLEDLAAVFDQAGLDAAAALADAVANPAEAQAAQDALSGQAAEDASTYVETFKETIEGLPISQALIDNIISAAEQADSPEVRAALRALAESLQLEIPITFGPLPTLPTFTDPSIRGRVEDRGGQGNSQLQGGVVVNQTFVTEPQPTTQTERAAAEINSVVSFAQGRGQ